MHKGGYVYILASKRHGTLYIGMTSNLAKRIDIHQMGIGNSFTAKYNVHLLVWYEWKDTIEEAIIREKQLKKWNRNWKIELIEQVNPKWSDLSRGLLD